MSSFCCKSCVYDKNASFSLIQEQEYAVQRNENPYNVAASWECSAKLEICVWKLIIQGKLVKITMLEQCFES